MECFKGKNEDFVADWLKSKGLESLVDVFESMCFTVFKYVNILLSNEIVNAKITV